MDVWAAKIATGAKSADHNLLMTLVLKNVLKCAVMEKDLFSNVMMEITKMVMDAQEIAKYNQASLAQVVILTQKITVIYIDKIKLLYNKLDKSEDQLALLSI